MALASETTKVSYAGDGTTDEFAVTFKFLQNSHVRAILRDANGAETVWVLDTDYSLTGAGADAGGTLTASTAPAVGETLVIKRAAPETQGVDLPVGGALSSTSLEDALDKTVMLVQAHSEELARAAKLKETSPTSGLTLPEPEADKLLGWNAGGTDLENKEAAAGGGGVTDHGALTGLADDDHTQYLKADGTRAMSGGLDMGANAITNVGNVDGRDVSADGTKLDGIEANADVTDAANVEAAGAIMDGDFSTNGLMERTGAGTYGTATEGTDYYAPGGTDVAVADGGTGASTASGARSNLGAQEQGDVLDDLNTLGAAASDGQFIVATGAGAFAYESGATVRASLGLGALAVLATVDTAQIDNDAVSNAKLANMATDTIKGRTTAGTGDPEDLTAAQARAVLNVEDGAQANTVDSVFSRTGAVTAAASDYDASQIDNDSGVSGAFVDDALDTLDAGKAALGQVTLNEQTATYTLVLTDQGKYVRMDVATANNLTVPQNSSVAFPTGAVVVVRQAGAGQTTLVADTNVTINVPTGFTLKLRGQGSQVSLVKVATNEWDAAGDLEASA